MGRTMEEERGRSDRKEIWGQILQVGRANNGKQRGTAGGQVKIVEGSEG
jgi:hypothetical protein